MRIHRILHYIKHVYHGQTCETHRIFDFPHWFFIVSIKENIITDREREIPWCDCKLQGWSRVRILFYTAWTLYHSRFKVTTTVIPRRIKGIRHVSYEYRKFVTAIQNWRVTSHIKIQTCVFVEVYHRLQVIPADWSINRFSKNYKYLILL